MAPSGYSSLLIEIILSDTVTFTTVLTPLYSRFVYFLPHFSLRIIFCREVYIAERLLFQDSFFSYNLNKETTRIGKVLF